MIRSATRGGKSTDTNSNVDRADSGYLSARGDDEFVDQSRQLRATVFLDEMATSSDGDVCLTSSPRDTTDEHGIAPFGHGVAVAETTQEWSLEALEHSPGNDVVAMARVVDGRWYQ